ncbi:MAG: hypothetical protein ETSY2_13500 [Candidatus Entotheonella gemina]|uniref:DUF4198 domain-containing protein n=1 Tax=Candidatus Entotheonella gemina TaxID=1429439 RepID=W4MA06_9BACT|nr:MAG: hypothetical protein ETSY2_13500 [Candidatus Entotheonella gemina]
MPSIAVPLIILFLLMVRPVAAHDYWIEASNFQLKSGDRVLFYLRVGEHFSGKPAAFSAEWVKRFHMHGATQQPPVALLRQDPAGMARVQESGLQVVSFENIPTYLELPAERFNSYLKAEGLEAVLSTRQEAGASDQLGKESYSRCAKALLWAAGDESAERNADHHNKPVGLTLELLPEQNPYRIKAPAQLAVQLLYKGQPVAGALVMALNKSAPNEVQRTPSGPDGRAEFNLHRSGLWMVKAVQMIPAEAQAKEDWRSYWASLTFELPAGP